MTGQAMLGLRISLPLLIALPNPKEGEPFQVEITETYFAMYIKNPKKPDKPTIKKIDYRDAIELNDVCRKIFTRRD